MAFEMARKRGKARQLLREQGMEITWKGPPRVTSVHKSNVLSVTDGLFRECVMETHKGYSDVQLQEQLVCCFYLHFLIFYF